MTPKITVLRNLSRLLVTFTLIVGMLAAVLILIKFAGADPEASIVGLVGVVVGAMSKPLADIVTSIAHNPSDGKPSNGNGDTS